MNRTPTLIAAAFALVLFGASSALAVDLQLYGIQHRSGKEKWLTIDHTTGIATEIALMEPDASNCCKAILGMTYDPFSQIMYGIDDNAGRRLLTIDIATGATAAIGATNLNAAKSLAFNPLDHLLYTVDIYGGIDELYKLNPATGAPTLVGSTNSPRITGMAFAPHPVTGEITLYALDKNTDMSLAIIDFNAQGGLLNLVVIGDLGFNAPDSLAYDWVNGVMYATDNNTNTLITIDLTTGAASLVHATNVLGQGNVQAIEFVYDAPVAVPEPSTLLLMGAGLFGLAALSRKKWRSAARAR